jgi:hypothetical protein
MDKEDYVAAVVRALPSVSDEEDAIMMKLIAGDCHECGFTLPDGIAYTGATEYVRPHLDEDEAIVTMNAIMAKYAR